MKAKSLIAICSLCVASSATSASSLPLPRPTQQQLEGLKTKVANATVPKNAKLLWQSASGTVAKITLILSCYPEPIDTALLKYVAPGNEHVPGFVFSQGVMDRAAYGGFRFHPKTQCVTVDRIDDVKAEAKNALSYRVVYVSDVSGETFITKYTMAQQPDGAWLYMLKD